MTIVALNDAHVSQMLFTLLFSKMTHAGMS